MAQTLIIMTFAAALPVAPSPTHNDEPLLVP
jgi:hypothetical protein